MERTSAEHPTGAEDSASLDRIIHNFQADQVERHLWDRTFEHPDGSFLKALLEQMGQTGGTIHQVCDFILRKQKDLLDGFGHVNGLIVGSTEGVPVGGVCSLKRLR